MFCCCFFYNIFFLYVQWIFFQGSEWAVALKRLKNIILNKVSSIFWLQHCWSILLHFQLNFKLPQCAWASVPDLLPLSASLPVFPGCTRWRSPCSCFWCRADMRAGSPTGSGRCSHRTFPPNSCYEEENDENDERKIQLNKHSLWRVHVNRL